MGDPLAQFVDEEMSIYGLFWKSMKELRVQIGNFKKLLQFCQPGQEQCAIIPNIEVSQKPSIREYQQNPVSSTLDIP